MLRLSRGCGPAPSHVDPVPVVHRLRVDALEECAGRPEQDVGITPANDRAATRLWRRLREFPVRLSPPALMSGARKVPLRTPTRIALRSAEVFRSTCPALSGTCAHAGMSKQDGDVRGPPGSAHGTLDCIGCGILKSARRRERSIGVSETGASHRLSAAGPRTGQARPQGGQDRRRDRPR